MKVKTKIDIELRDELAKVREEKDFLNFIFEYCESQEDRKRLLDFIKESKPNRKEILLMASQIGIESGNVEGELIEE